MLIIRHCLILYMSHGHLQVLGFHWLDTVFSLHTLSITVDSDPMMLQCENEQSLCLFWARISLSGRGIKGWGGTWSFLDSSKSSRTLHAMIDWLWLPTPVLMVVLLVESGSKLPLHYRVCIMDRVLLCDVMDTRLELF